MSLRYTVPTFEFAPEVCHDQNYGQICDLFKSFRVHTNYSQSKLPLYLRKTNKKTTSYE